MSSAPRSAATQTSEDRESRRQHILAAPRRDAEGALERTADELADLPDDRLFGAIEYEWRGLAHDLAASAHQAGLGAGKKGAA